MLQTVSLRFFLLLVEYSNRIMYTEKKEKESLNIFRQAGSLSLL